MRSRRSLILLAAIFACGLTHAIPSQAIPGFSFSTGDPDGKMAMASRPGSGGKIEIEAADDFILTQATSLTHASFTGLISGDLSNIAAVNVEIYRVFPYDSQNPPIGSVPTRVNSPSDVAFDSRESGLGGLSFATTTLSPNFTAANSVLNGIHPVPNTFTGGEGAVRGTEVRFDVNFASSIFLPDNHYFFVPQVQMLGNDEFYWLSAPKPITGGTGPFAPDLQTWIRDSNLDPNWLRVGTDITGQGPFNASFSLEGGTTPEPGTLMLLGLGGAILLMGVSRRQ